MFRFYSKDDVKNRVTVVGEHKDGLLKVAVARCSDLDRFDRKKGRMIAEGRLRVGKLILQERRENVSINDFIQLATHIESYVSTTKWYNL